eukprot:scaffold1175_cov248-Pinguiococcus_pyrenoidosus.AAC.14
MQSTRCAGKVESGAVRRGQKVCIMPGDNIATVQAVYCDDEPVSRVAGWAVGWAEQEGGKMQPQRRRFRTERKTWS